MGLSPVLIHQISTGSGRGPFVGGKCKVKSTIREYADRAETIAGQSE